MTNRATSSGSGAVSAFIEILGPWAAGSGPIFRQLARGVASAVERGVLAHGARIPSERSLAHALSIGRGTAVAAYDLLVADGLVERRRGSGTFVAAAGELNLPQGREGSALVHRLVDRSDSASDVIDLSISVLRDTHGLPQVALSVADLSSVVPDTGYSPWGLPTLRRAVAEHIDGWGVPTTEHQVVITTGAQQAISAAAACWLRPGDTVITDDPTYPGALAAFHQAGANVVGVPVDHHGVRVDALERALGRRPAMVYLQSSVHSPTGAVLAASRRRDIAELVSRTRVPLIEDLALADLAWRATPPPIAAHAPAASIAVVGSLSKLFWGGLRVGFVRAPEPLALRFARVKATHDLGSSAVSQLFALRLLQSRSAPDLPHVRSAQLRERFEVLAAALRRHVPAWTWSEPSGGLSVWVATPSGSAEAFAHFALRHRVAVAAPSALSPSGASDRHLRLSFAGPPAELEEGARRLGTAWAARHRP